MPTKMQPDDDDGISIIRMGDPNDKPPPVVFDAVHKDQIGVIAWWLGQNGPKWRETDENGLSPLHLAASLGRSNLVNIMVRCFARYCTLSGR